jgi:hypothetical protein
MHASKTRTLHSSSSAELPEPLPSAQPRSGSSWSWYCSNTVAQQPARLPLNDWVREGILKPQHVDMRRAGLIRPAHCTYEVAHQWRGMGDRARAAQISSSAPTPHAVTATDLGASTGHIVQRNPESLTLADWHGPIAAATSPPLKAAPLQTSCARTPQSPRQTLASIRVVVGMNSGASPAHHRSNQLHGEHRGHTTPDLAHQFA